MDTSISGGVSGVGRASGRGQARAGVDPIAAQAAAAAQVRTYRDNGVKHSSSSYNRVSSYILDIDSLTSILRLFRILEVF